MPVYHVRDTETNKERLIRAKTPAAALRYIAETRLTCAVVRQDNLIRLLTVDGVKVEDADDQPPETP